MRRLKSVSWVIMVINKAGRARLRRKDKAGSVVFFRYQQKAIDEKLKLREV